MMGNRFGRPIQTLDDVAMILAQGMPIDGAQLAQIIGVLTLTAAKQSENLDIFKRALKAHAAVLDDLISSTRRKTFREKMAEYHLRSYNRHMAKLQKRAMKYVQKAKIIL